MASNFDDFNAAEALNQAWDRDVLGQLNDADDLESFDIAFIADLRACDDAPPPDEIFRAQLRQQFANPATEIDRQPRPSPVNLGLVRSYPTPWPIVPIRRLLIAGAVAACMTFIVSTGTGLFHDQAHAPVIASALASPQETATAGPTMTTWLTQTRTTSPSHEVTLLPHFALTVINNDSVVLAPRTPLTVFEVATDGTGKQWLHVQTNDGRTGWLLQTDTYPIVQ